jgi:hypothetical protein
MADEERLEHRIKPNPAKAEETSWHPFARSAITVAQQGI